MQNRYHSWKEQCAQLGELSLARYGGGESFQLCATKKQISLSSPFPEESNIQDWTIKQTKIWLDNYNKVPEHRRIATIPQKPFTATIDDLTWTSTITLVEGLSNTPYYNIILHGWLLKQEFEAESERDRLGASSWPLVGIKQSHNIKIDDLVTREYEDTTGEISQWTGHEILNAADQHCHWVDEFIELDGYPLDLSSWNIGGDMGRFSTEKSNETAFAWIIAICPIRLIAQVSLLIILPAGSNTNATSFPKTLEQHISEEIVQEAKKCFE